MASKRTWKIKTKQKPTKYEDINYFSKIFFCWFIPIYKKGFTTTLAEEDLIVPGYHLDARTVGDKMECAWKHELNFEKHPSLLRALWKVTWKDIVLSGLLLAFAEGVRVTQPILISKYLSYFTPGSKITKTEAYEYAGYLILSSMVSGILFNVCILKFIMFGYKVKVALGCLLYRKALTLKKSSIARIGLGKIVNLLGNDAYRLFSCLIFGHLVWLAPVETFIVAYLMYLYLGLSTLVGSVLCIMSIPFQAWLSRKTFSHRLKAASKTDERLKLMNDIILGIKIIKMYTWEKPFAKLIGQSRKKEIKQLLNVAIINSILFSLSVWMSRTAICATLVTYVLAGNAPTPQYIFTLVSFHEILKILLTQTLSQCTTGLAEGAISICRLKEFYLHDADSNECKKYLKEAFAKVDDEDFVEKGICIKNVSAKWLENTTALSEINFEAVGSQITAIVGPVGSGKSTLLHLMLKELQPFEGSITVNGKLSYASQEPWLFEGNIKDNILFGQPFNKSKYDEVIKVCALQQDLSVLPHGDHSLVGERGITLSGGQKARINIARAIYNDADIYLLDDPLSSVDARVGKHIFEQCICSYLKGKCVILVTHQLQYLNKVHRICIMENGEIKEIKDNLDCHIIASSLDNCIEEKWSRITHPTLVKQNKEHVASGTVSKNAYLVYAQSAGCAYVIMVAITCVLTQVMASFADYFLGVWANFSQWNTTRLVINNETQNYCHQTSMWYSWFIDESWLILYSTVIGLIILFALSKNVLFFKAALRSGFRMHNRMFEKLCKADMLFYCRNSSGRILNRVSRDVNTIDEIVSVYMFFTVQAGMTIIGVAIIIGITQVWMILPSLMLFISFYMLREIFVRTSTSLKRLDATTRSSSVSHLTSTLHGLTTIKAFGAQDMLRKQFESYENRNSSAFFMYVCASRAFGTWMDLDCVIYISFIVFSFLLVDGDVLGGNVGMVITQSLSLLNLFSWGLRQWGDLENQMTSVERVKEYIDIEPESKGIVEDTKDIWPNNGVIEFRNVSLKYSSDDRYVIKDINFTIKSKTKIGIVGRTGAGKTSLINALFRLMPIDGTITIDDVDIKNCSLKKVRSSIAIIPQEPVVFSGSIRSNLDPFGDYTDELLWKALDDVELKSVVQSLLSEVDSNFSIGQRQLLCLARALLRKIKILVLDEATANLDLRTDALIQSTIRRKFSHCTVIVIAHRLHNVMDSQRILVMDDGSIKEFDHPYVLLRNRIGAFRRMVDQTGDVTAAELLKIAKESFLKRNLDDD